VAIADQSPKDREIGATLATNSTNAYRNLKPSESYTTNQTSNEDIESVTTELKDEIKSGTLDVPGETEMRKLWPAHKDSALEYSKLLKNDVYLTLKFLCHKSYTDEQQNATSSFNPLSASSLTSKPLQALPEAATRSRVLAMELLMSVYNNAGQVLLTDELLIQIAQQHVCQSVSKNAVTTNPTLFELSLSILLLCIRHYRHKLKLEVEVLLSTVYLQILEMGNSSYNQRSIVLQALNKICGNPQVPHSFNTDTG
jgi:Guanine nucleotide exchange factor in Golgi transport N-terminal